MADDLFSMTLADKLYKTKYEPDSDHPHVKVDLNVCRECRDKVCLRICPAEVYRADPNDAALITISHDNCLECGTCRRACERGAIDWKYPDGGLGVKYRFG